MDILMFAADKSADAGDWKAGDVIACCPDGWQWSEAEATNPLWIIVNSPITKIEADALVAPPIDGVTGMRRYLLDPSGLSAGQVLTHNELMARVSMR